MTGPLWLHAGALPVVHVFLDAGGALDRDVAGLQGACALVVFGVNALLADVSRRRLAADSTRLDEARARAAAAERLAYEDPRTGLPSRNRGLQRLDALLASGRRGLATVALVDVDRFRAVNQVLGNAAGDELLRGVTERLRGVLRESDFLGRLWDDEFLVVADGLEEAGDSRRLGRQLLQAFAAPFRVAETELFVTATVGVARISAGTVSVASLLRGLDGTVRRGKAAGGDRLEFFDPTANAASPETTDLELWLRRAKAEDFGLLYRPVVELPGRTVVGFEALLHWRRPDLGLVPVTELPGSADGAGVPARLTPWVLGEACRAAASWPPNGDRGLAVTVSLSPLQFLDADLPRHVRTALGRSGLAGRQLILGVREGTVARNVDRTLRGFHELKELGTRISVDGFGRGGCCLSALRELPIDLLSIDGSLVRGLGESDGDETAAAAAIAIARALRLVAVAEGVESERDLAALLSLDCRRATGRLFGAGVPAEAVPELLWQPSVPGRPS